METNEEVNVMNKTKKYTTYQITSIALMAAVMCILGPMSVPIGPIPVSLTNLVIYFTVYVIGVKSGTISFIIYMLLGMAGLPVFSGFSGGVSKLAGPTGGFIIGFAFMSVIGGFIMEKCNRKTIPTFFGWVLGSIVNYIFGTVWFIILTGTSFSYALKVCVIPFIGVDIAKIVIGMLIGSQVRKPLLKIIE